MDLRYEDKARGRVETVRADYVVGCDGARSLVRQSIGSGMEDYGFHERWLVVDVILKDEKPELGEHSVQYCVPERPATYVRCPGMRRRWEITVRPDEHAKAVVRPERVWDLLSDWISPEEAALERATVYVFHSLIAETWRKGRLLLAGDACHQTPPFMGQGMCAGIRDVANLYWKLALACRGAAAERLLDSYQSERGPNVAAYIQTAVRLGGLINTCGTKDALRAALPAGNGAAQGSARMESIAPPLGTGLGIGDKAGRLFGQPRLADGRLMDEACPHSFVVVVDEDLTDGLTLPDGVALVTTGGSDAANHLDRLGCRAALLRPDRHTLGTADSPEQLAVLLQHVPSNPISRNQT